MNIAPARLLGQTLDQAYRDSILADFDSGLPDSPDSTLWSRAQAEVMRRVALILLHSNHVPGFGYDAILPLAQDYQMDTGE